MIARGGQRVRRAETEEPLEDESDLGDRGAPPLLFSLQHQAGNRAVARLVASRAPAAAEQGERDAAQAGSGSPPSASPIDRYRAALAGADWDQAAILLNGLSDDDIQARVSDTGELPPASRALLREHTQEWNHRVRRALLLLDFADAKTAGNWSAAADLMNGFNDPDIHLLAAQLGTNEVGPLTHAAIQAHLDRVLHGISERYDAVSPDPAGTKVLTVVELMRAAGSSIAGARAYVELKLGVHVGPGSAPGQAPADHQGDVAVLSAAIMGSAGPVVTAGGAGVPGAPTPLPPQKLEEGNLAHELIGDVYVGLNPLSVSDMSVADIMASAKGRIPGLAKAMNNAKADLFTNLDMRPDITDLGKLQIFEIKPVGSTALAVAEAVEYVELFDSLGIEGVHFTLGDPGNRGARGMIPGPDGATLVWASPLPGAIVYTYVSPPESPERAQERIESGAYEPGAGIGVEAITGLGLAAVAAAASLPAVAPTVFESYATLSEVLAAATRVTGQAVPIFAPG